MTTPIPEATRDPDHEPKRKPRPQGQAQARQSTVGAEGSPNCGGEAPTATVGVLHNTRHHDWRIIALIGSVHASSHFMQLLLPALYLSLNAEFGFDFVRLGLLVSVFFVISGVGQAVSGFVVDRVGAVPVLYFGMGCFVLGAVLIAAANGYAMLILGAIVCGTGNAIFHPVDYSILNQRVSGNRLGHAFSAHGLTGYLGWALTPVFISTISLLAGWRMATFAAAALVGGLLVWVYAWRDLLAWERSACATVNPAHLVTAKPAATLTHLLGQPALWGAFLFFAFSSIGFSAVQQYTIPLFTGTYQIDALLAGSTLSAYMIAAALGMAAGGFLATASAASERIVAASLVLAGVLLVLLTANGLPLAAAVVLIALAGFCSGIAAPSRDLLVRRVTPKGATGSVYGLVYSGMDVGTALGPVLFGLMLDHGLHQGPWFGAGAGYAMAAWLALLVARFAMRGRVSDQ